MIKITVIQDVDSCCHLSGNLQQVTDIHTHTQDTQSKASYITLSVDSFFLHLNKYNYHKL